MTVVPGGTSDAAPRRIRRCRASSDRLFGGVIRIADLAVLTRPCDRKVRGVSYQLARAAIVQLKQGVGRLVSSSNPDPATRRFDLDGTTVAVSGRWYERAHDSQLGAAEFLSLTPAAQLADGVVALPVGRGRSIVVHGRYR